MIDTGNLTTLMYCFDLVISCEVGGWWLRILMSCFNVSMFIIWFRVGYLILPLYYDSELNIFSLNSCLLKKLPLLYGVLLSCLLINILLVFVCIYAGDWSVKVEGRFGIVPGSVAMRRSHVHLQVNSLCLHTTIMLSWYQCLILQEICLTCQQ